MDHSARHSSAVHNELAACGSLVSGLILTNSWRHGNKWKPWETTPHRPTHLFFLSGCRELSYRLIEPVCTTQSHSQETLCSVTVFTLLHLQLSAINEANKIIVYTFHWLKYLTGQLIQGSPYNINFDWKIQKEASNHAHWLVVGWPPLSVHNFALIYRH